MSERIVRESTKNLRRCYPQITPIKHARRPRLIGEQDRGDDTERGTMADQTPANTGDGQEDGQPGDANQIPHASDDEQDQPGGGPGHTDTPKSGKSPATPEKDQGYDLRLKNIEEILIDMRRERGRSSKAPESRSRSKSKTSVGSTASRPKINQPTTRSPPRRRSGSRRTRRYSRSRSRSHRRSSSRRSGRSRRSSRSHSRRRTRSRSHRSSRRRSRSTRSRSRSRRSRSRHRRSHSRPRRTRSRSHGRRASPMATTSGIIRVDEGKAIGDQYPRIGTHKGIKSLPTYKVSLEPYHNLPPDIREKARARRSRKELTYQEHMCGMLHMILKTLDPESETYSAVRHLAQVSQDAVTMMWPGVREWSQACLTHIQDGGATWTSKEVFSGERTRISWFKGRPKKELRVPCHTYNLDQCDEGDTHTAPGIAFIHVCAVCFYGQGDEKFNHHARTCWKKSALKTAQEDPRNERRKVNRQQQSKKEDRYEKTK